MHVDGIGSDSRERAQTAFLFGLSASGIVQRGVDRFEVPSELTPQPGLPVVVEQNRLGDRIDDQTAGCEMVLTAGAVQGIGTLPVE